MNIIIKTTGIELTPALDQYARYKVAKIGKYINETNSQALAAVEVGKATDHHRRGEIFRAEINLEIPGQSLKRAEVNHYDLYNAIVLARDELVRQVKSQHAKQKTLDRKGGRRLKDMLRGWRHN